MVIEAKNIRVEFVASFQEIEAALWQKCFPPTLEGRFWYQTLETSGLEDQFTFRYARIKTNDKAVGIVPCFIHDVPISLVAPPLVASAINFLSRFFPRVGYQRTLFVGSPCSDEGSIGLVPGVQLSAVAAAVFSAVQAEARRQKAPMIVFKDFHQEDLAAMEWLSAKGRFFPVVSYPGTVVTLTTPDKAAYFKALSSMQRHNFLKKLRRSAELLPLETSIVERPSDEVLTEIWGLFQQTYEKGKTKFERLDRRFFESIREQPEARFILQRDKTNGQLLTFMLVFCLGDRVINKFIGIDYSRSGKTYLYFRLFDAALDFAYSHGAKELQSGQTGYRAKLDLGHRLVPLFNLVRHKNPLVNAIYRTIGTRVSWRSLDNDLATFLLAHPECDLAKLERF
jgi:predicted N-acyltransferase